MNEIKRRSAALVDLDRAHTWLLEAAAKLSQLGASRSIHHKRCVELMSDVDLLRRNLALLDVPNGKAVNRV